ANPEFEDAFDTEQITTGLDNLLVGSAQKAFVFHCDLTAAWPITVAGRGRGSPPRTHLAAPNGSGGNTPAPLVVASSITTLSNRAARA
ncbi:hypothetical protein KI387_008869, partial [Taxus chinensis]